jgi:hypothetical protein
MSLKSATKPKQIRWLQGIQWGKLSNSGERAELNGQLANATFGDVAFSLMSDLNQQPLAVASLFVRATELDATEGIA